MTAAGRLRRARRAVTLARLASLAGAAAFVAFAADMVTRPLPSVVGYTPDDAFYYLQIARHLAQSGRSTFDGINPTNGYHPGWMAVLVPVALVFREPGTLLRAAVAVSLLLHLLASALLARAVRFVLGRLWGWVAGLCWLWSPLPLVLALQAMETSLLLAAVAGAVLVYVTRIVPRGRTVGPARGDVLAFAAALAAVVWARTDMLVLAACGSVAVACAWRGVPRPSPRARILAGALTFAVALVSLVPWWVFSWREVGTAVQDSAVMKSLWGHALRQDLGLPAELAQDRHFVSRALSLAFEGLLGRAGTQAGAVELAVAVLVALAIVRRAPRVRRVRWLLAWLGAATVLTLVAYGLVISDLQVWYVAVPGMVAWLSALSACAIVGRRFRLTVAATLAGVSGLLGFWTWLRPPVLYPWQRDVLGTLAAFEARVPAPARVGCFNAGIPAYFGSRTVVNLDGLVNHAVVAYWRRRRFPDYVRDAHIEYIADEEGALRRAAAFSSRNLALVPLASAPLTGWATGRRVLWRVAEEPPAPATARPQ